MQAVGFEEQLAAIQQARSEDQPESLYHLEHMQLWTKLRPYVRVISHSSCSGNRGDLKMSNIIIPGDDDAALLTGAPKVPITGLCNTCRSFLRKLTRFLRCISTHTATQSMLQRWPNC